MSKFRRRIRQLGRPASGGIGFAPTRDGDGARQVLVVAEVASAEQAAAALEAGADALLAAPGAVEAAVRAAGDRPVGARLDAVTVESVADAARAGADFFLFDDAQTPATALLPRDDVPAVVTLGRVLRLGEDQSEERLRAIAAINLDAMIVEGLGSAITVREQIRLRRLTDLAAVPLIAAIAEAPSTQGLQVWRDAGAPIALVGADPALVRATREAAAQVPPPRRARGERPALVPLLPGHYGDDEDDRR
ncbi:MAG: hypothetical protein FJZ92_01465 [Chloroflexi bacterium]|nr:hypothetical protein [Chloroflexota bacterium]